MVNSDNYHRPYYVDKEHVPEFLGSTKLAEQGKDRHNHQFAGVTGEAIPIKGDSNTHRLFTNTDFFENHHHELSTQTSLAIPVGEGRHIHFVRARNTVDDGHFHLAIFATLTEYPLS
ncbi:YmaF family protein [Anaerosalibacter massiliensis]|uniref:YmaF family protein n=1 Tax=Anaerosalibacter massiliensis TaxID=1347392 RepID=UPI0005B26414|nr:YmaF family protein [Anaerosalibacter massiliensis]